MKIVGISGTEDYEGKSGMALLACCNMIPGMGNKVDLINVGEWELGWGGQGEDSESLQGLVSDADFVVISTPEYNGGYSAAVKIIIDNLGYPSALKDKNVGLIAVAGGKSAHLSMEALTTLMWKIGAKVNFRMCLAKPLDEDELNEEIIRKALADYLPHLFNSN